MASQVTGERHFYPFLIWECAAVVKIRSEKFQEMYIFAQFFPKCGNIRRKQNYYYTIHREPFVFDNTLFSDFTQNVRTSRMTTYMLLHVGTKYDKYIKKLSGYRNPY